MSVPSDVARDIDRVLRPLEGHGLYRNNAFRVTGLPTDVSNRQVRRHREETQNPYYVTPVPDGDVPLPPSDDPDALRAAFEVLRDPLARLVHELFWIRSDQPSWHEHAVFAHSRALEGTTPDGRVAHEETWDDWRVGLRLLAQAFAAEVTWEWVRSRAAEIDDPRLSVAVLRALRDRLPEHVIGVSVGLAVRAAGVGQELAEHQMKVLRGAGFEPMLVRDAARAAVEPATARVRSACESAREAEPSAGLSAASALLEETTSDLATCAAVLGNDDDVVGACRDEVARSVNNCVLGFVNLYVETAPAALSTQTVLDLLREARALASSPSVATLLDNNIADIEGYQARRAAGAGSGADLGCLPLLFFFLVGGVASWLFVYNVMELGPIWSVVLAVFGGFTAVGLVGQVVEFFQAVFGSRTR
ncbi:hypothetical protein [Promicromonospora sp. NPDC060271]|uniref:hypothetical protein n=1 Tax=Promicromonospora sp. NPDC060271 TaxID=3347089 RepID=UPI00366368BA